MEDTTIDIICKDVFESRNAKESIISACHKRGISTAIYNKWKVTHEVKHET